MNYRKHFSLESLTEVTLTETEPNIKSLIHEMGFKEKSPEYQACVNFLEARKQNLAKNTAFVDLVCSMNRPKDRAMSQRNRQTIFVTLTRLQKLNNIASKRFWLKDFKIGRAKKSSVKVLAECRHMRSFPIFVSHQLYR